MTAEGPRVGWAMSGEIGDLAHYSGLPASMAAALTGAGIEVVPISAELPAPAQRLLVNVAALGFLSAGQTLRGLASGRNPRLVVRDQKPKLLPSREMTALRSRLVAGRLGRVGGLDGLIQFGTEFLLPAGRRYITLDDATIQAMRVAWPYEWMQAVPETALNRMIARQARILRGATACCVLTHWAAESVERDYGVDPERIVVVGLGSNRQALVPERDFSTPRFLFVGVDFERKNGPAVLEAFARVRDRHPDATLDVVGGHPPLSRENVTGHGLLKLDDPVGTRKLNELFQRATCFVMPSRFDPSGNVFAEALHNDLGAIGTTHGGASTVTGNAGIMVEPDDHRAILAAMERFCDPDTAAEFSARARARAPLFTWRAVAERMIGALDLPGVDTSGLAAPL